jgi:hypothetical protein
MKKISVSEELLKRKIKTSKEEDAVISEVYSILQQDLLSDKKVLENLHHYKQSFEVLNEKQLDVFEVYKLDTIKTIAIDYRLKFLDSKYFKGEIPYEAVLKIKDLNTKFKKDLKHFKILGKNEAFQKTVKPSDASSLLLFAATDLGNHYLIHKWGHELPWHRKILSWPMRRFETLLVSIALISLILAISLPTRLIWLPQHADYWGTYRIGAFFHILIFNLGVSAYITFAFGKNFSANTWQNVNDFH